MICITGILLQKKDLEIFSYEMCCRVFTNAKVQTYLEFIEIWQDNQKYGKNYQSYKKYCKERVRKMLL